MSDGLLDPWMWMWVAEASEKDGFLGRIADRWLREQLAAEEPLMPSILLNIPSPKSRSRLNFISETIFFKGKDLAIKDLGAVDLYVAEDFLLPKSRHLVLGLKVCLFSDECGRVERLLMPKVLAKNRYWRRTLYKETGEKALPVKEGDAFCLMTRGLIARFLVMGCYVTNGYLLQSVSIDAAIYRNVAKERMLDPRMLTAIANALLDDGMWPRNPLFITPIEAAVVDTVSVPVEGEVS